jgi:DNA-directed RNA polymerase subunit E'/Rpb7
MELKELTKNVNNLQFLYMHPRDVYTNMEENMLAAHKKEIEGRCLDIGYVIRVNKIVNHSEPKINSLDFSGNIVFSVLANIDIINPQRDDIIKGCRITLVNKIGIFAQKEFIRILIPSDSNQDSGIPANYQDIYSDGDMIDVRVISSNIDMKKDYISVWGYLEGGKKKK